jgi:hypothetical protein
MNKFGAVTGVFTSILVKSLIRMSLSESDSTALGKKPEVFSFASTSLLNRPAVPSASPRVFGKPNEE